MCIEAADLIVEMEDPSTTIADLCCMELCILTRLRFRLSVVTAAHFAPLFCTLGGLVPRGGQKPTRGSASAASPVVTDGIEAAVEVRAGAEPTDTDAPGPHSRPHARALSVSRTIALAVPS